MNAPPSKTSSASSQSRTAVAFLVLLGSLLAIAMHVYRTAGRSVSSWSPRSAIAISVAALVAVIAGATLAIAFVRSRHNRAEFLMPVMASALTAVACITFAEIAIRILVRPDPFGVRFGARTLLPYDWRVVADSNLARWRFFRSRPEAYFTEDTLLGWTVGNDRQSTDGMYKSGEDGIRTMERGERLPGRDVGRRVALFGDSYTFSMEVPFEESWSHFLPPLLPAGAQVLNFGVDGFGVDQTYLRFQRELPKWRPRVAVFSFIEDDLFRSVSSYPFLRGWSYPFSRPRFRLERDSLRLDNVPTASAEWVFSRPSIDDLPFISDDVFFSAEHWKRRWIYHSYVARLAVTMFPRWPLPTDHPSEESMLRLNARIIEQFVSEARKAGSEPLVVYLPARVDFQTTDHVVARLDPLLAQRGIRVNDLTACLTKRVSPTAMFLAGRVHYTAAANAAVAACIAPLVTPFVR